MSLFWRDIEVENNINEWRNAVKYAENSCVIHGNRYPCETIQFEEEWS